MYEARSSEYLEYQGILALRTIGVVALDLAVIKAELKVSLQSPSARQSKSSESIFVPRISNVALRVIPVGL